MKFYNEFIIKRILEILRLKGTKTIDSIENKLRLVREIKPNIEIIRLGQNDLAATTITVYTTENDAEKDFYFIGYSLTMFNGANGTASIRITLSGTERIIASVSLLANSVINNQLFFPLPIKMEKNSTIRQVNEAGASSTRTLIFGYYE